MALSAAQPLKCSRCKTVLPLETVLAGGRTACPSCHVPLIAEAFPALFRGAARGEQPQAVLQDGEAGCFYHADKRAVRACEDCGRFICALCDIEVVDRHVCPVCVQTANRKGKHERLQRSRLLHDEIALAVALLPLLIWPVTLLTAPAAMYLALRHWKTPLSVLPRTRIRLVLAMFFALLQIVGWIALLIVIIT